MLTTLLLAWLLITLASGVGLLAFLAFDERQVQERRALARRRTVVALWGRSGRSHSRHRADTSERAG